jgi:hypothetical protein
MANSTTVIASAYGASLYLAPWRTAQVDTAQIRAVFRSHGVQLLDDTPVTGQLEFIAAADLPADRAAAFANDLRRTGLVVRVVNDPSITQSARLSNAMAAMLLITMLTFPLVVPAILALLNFAVIWTNGFTLTTTGAVRSRDTLADQVLLHVSALEESLPDALVHSLREQVETLGRRAPAEPDGPEAGALRDVIADLTTRRAELAEASARRLKADLRRAQAAVREVP